MRAMVAALIVVQAVISTLVSARAGAQRLDPGGDLGGVDAALVVRFDDLASLMRTPSGRSLARLADGLGVFERTRGAWDDLSGALGLEPGEAIDRLLGGRAVLLVDDLGKGDTRWAWVMEVGVGVAGRLPERLKAAPRGGMDGRAVYAVEDGRFRVVVTRHGVSSVAVAPAGSDAMLRAAADLGSRWRARRGGAEAGADTSVLYRPALGSWLSGRLRPVEGGWRMSFRASPGLLSDTGGPAISRRWFDSVSDDAAFSFIGPIGGAGSPGGPGSLFDLRPNGVIWRLVPLHPPEAFVTGRAAAGTVTISSLGRGRLDCSIGFLADGREEMLREGDAYACGLLESFTGSKGYRDNVPLCTGAYPVAARLQRVELAEGNPRRALYGPRLSFVWGVGPSADGGTWWSMRVMSDDVADAAATLLRLRSPVGGVADRGGGGAKASMMGLIRPPRLLGMLAGERADGEPGGAISALRWVDEIRWWAGAGGAGGTAGEVSVLMRPPP